MVKNSSLTEKPGSVVSAGGEPWCWFLCPGGGVFFEHFHAFRHCKMLQAHLADFLLWSPACSGLRPFLQGLFCGICTLLWRSYSDRAYYFYLEIIGTGRTQDLVPCAYKPFAALKDFRQGKVKHEENTRDAWMVLMWAECPLAQPANLHNCHSSPAHASLAHGLSLLLSDSWSDKGSALLPPTWRGDRSPNRLIPRVISLW